jgi:hypothetical protein
LRCSRAGSDANGVAQDMQKRASARFSTPQFGHADMARSL